MKKYRHLLYSVLPMLALSVSITAQDNSTKITAALQQKMDNTSTPTEFRCIVSFHSPEEAYAGRPILQQLGATFVGPKFTDLPLQGIMASADELTKMKDIAGLWVIEEDQKLDSDMHQAVIVSGVKDVWTDAEFTALNGGLPVTGHGIGVLVNDSGFDAEGTDLEALDSLAMAPGKPRRVVQSIKGTGAGGTNPTAGWDEDFANGEGEAGKRFSDEGGGHGTHCLGIVGGDGRRSNGKYKGVAPGAYLLGYGSGAGLSILDVAGGFEYVLKHGRDYNIRVMSNSYGSTGDTTFTSFNAANATSIATKALADKGVQVVFSAGNSGPANGTITGNFKTAPWVVAIGNGLKGGGLASSSSRGRTDATGNAPMSSSVTVGGKDYFWENRPTVTAPGTDIVSVRATEGGSASGLTSDAVLTVDEIPFYTVLTGTSMACPHVAGIVALMMEANPNLEWRAIKATLQRTAVPMTEKRWESGYGYVNAWAAVASAYHGLCDVPANATHEEKYGLNPNGNFGFAGEAWQNCTLHPEVASRIRATLPSPGAVELLCGAGNTVITDVTGSPDATATQFDIKNVTFENETATTFDVVLEITGNLALVTPGNSQAGTTTNQNYFDVHFVLNKPTAEGENTAPDVTYIVSAYNEVTSGFNYVLTVKSGDGTTRPATHANYRKTIGNTATPNGSSWNTTTNKITWRVPKNQLTVKATPAATSTAAPAPDAGITDGMGGNASRVPRIGDALKTWRAYTYTRPPGVTPDGPGVYNDQAAGTCFKLLQQ